MLQYYILDMAEGLTFFSTLKNRSTYKSLRFSEKPDIRVWKKVVISFRSKSSIKQVELIEPF